MNSLDVVTEQRFFKTPDGIYWTENSYDYSFWCRYLMVYNSVNVVARVRIIDYIEVGNRLQVCGHGVSVVDIPYYIGPKDFLKVFHKIVPVMFSRRKLKQDAIVRIPGILGFIYYLIVNSSESNVGAEVVGDPREVFSGKGFLEKLYKMVFYSAQKWVCRKSQFVSYVTKEYLQKIYPCNSAEYTSNYSSIDLNKDDYRFVEDVCHNKKDSVNIVCIGKLNYNYKGCDFLLSAVSDLKTLAPNVKINWIGDGRLLSKFETLSKDIGASDTFDFIGNVSDKDVMHGFIDSADLFLLTSRQEGLPRVLMEAMARKKFCISSNVGGASELIDSEYLFEVDNYNEFLSVFKRYLNLSEHEISEVAQRNYKTALKYSQDELNERRKDFYQAILSKRI